MDEELPQDGDEEGKKAKAKGKAKAQAKGKAKAKGRPRSSSEPKAKAAPAKGTGGAVLRRPARKEKVRPVTQDVDSEDVLEGAEVADECTPRDLDEDFAAASDEKSKGEPCQQPGTGKGRKAKPDALERRSKKAKTEGGKSQKRKGEKIEASGVEDKSPVENPAHHVLDPVIQRQGKKAKTTFAGRYPPNGEDALARFTLIKKVFEESVAPCLQSYHTGAEAGAGS